MALADPPRLGCGRSIDQVWAGIDAPPTSHEQGCAQCQAARTKLKKLNEATHAMRVSDLHDPSRQPGAGLTEAIMAVARAEVRRGRILLLLTTTHGTLEVSEQALGSLVRSVATAVPGIHSRRCRIEIHESTPLGPNVTGRALQGQNLVINLRVACASGIDIPGTAQALRHGISEAIPALIGVGAATINITVEDLYDV